MSLDLQFILGCFGFGLVIGYACWVLVRADLLRSDLATILDQLDRTAAARDLTSNKYYIWVSGFILLLRENTTYLTPSVLLMVGMVDKLDTEKTDVEQGTEESPGIRNDEDSQHQATSHLGNFDRSDIPSYLRIPVGDVNLGVISQFAADMPEEVKTALVKVFARLLVYMLLECVSGWAVMLILVWMSLTGKLRDLSPLRKIIQLELRHLVPRFPGTVSS